VVVAQLPLEEIHRRASRGTAAGGVIIDAEQRVLLVKHSYGPLNWEIPGGAAELDETPTQTALREVREETGLAVIAESLSGIYYERKAAGFEVLHFTFRCRLTDQTAHPAPCSPEITRCAFWPLDGLPRPITDFTLLRIRGAVDGVPGLLPISVGKPQILT
jgi:8-oxo-dGTP diphosphatase